MNAGLPGTGIGGLFYMASAFMMPLRILRDARRNRIRTTSSSRSAGTRSAGPRVRPLQQFAIAAGILASLFATGWLIGLLLPPELIRPRMGGPPIMREVQNVVRWASLAGTAGILLVVLASVEVATLLTRRAGAKGLAGSAPAVARARSSSLSKVA
jgi:hypothetical protein